MFDRERELTYFFSMKNSLEWKKLQKALVRPIDILVLSQLQDEIQGGRDSLAFASEDVEDQGFFDFMRTLSFASLVRARVFQKRHCKSTSWITIYKFLFEMTYIDCWSDRDVRLQ